MTCTNFAPVVGLQSYTYTIQNNYLAQYHENRATFNLQCGLSCSWTDLTRIFIALIGTNIGKDQTMGCSIHHNLMLGIRNNLHTIL